MIFILLFVAAILGSAIFAYPAYLASRRRNHESIRRFNAMLDVHERDRDNQEAAYAKTWQGQIDVAAEKFRALGRAIRDAFRLR